MSGTPETERAREALEALAWIEVELSRSRVMNSHQLTREEIKKFDLIAAALRAALNAPATEPCCYARYSIADREQCPRHSIVRSMESIKSASQRP